MDRERAQSDTLPLAMKRRSFFTTLAGAFVASAVSIGLSRAEPAISAPKYRWDKHEHVGNFQWIFVPN